MNRQQEPSTFARAWGAPLGWAKAMMSAPRLLLAIKVSLAASLAWSLAPLIPFVDGQYSYYAPLGVLVSMYPTIAGSVRSSVQALLGLAIGIGLGIIGVGALFAGIPGALTLAVVVGVGVLFGGVAALGEGRSWVPIAALFVLVLSGADADEFSLSYLLMMSFGIVVGLVVNFAFVPPLYLRQANRRLTAWSDVVSDSLLSLAEDAQATRLDETTRAAWSRRLDDMATEVRAEVTEADRSGAANPRARGHRQEQQENLRRLRALDHISAYTGELGTVLFDQSSRDSASDTATTTRLSQAVRAAGDLVGTRPGAKNTEARLEAANRALTDYVETLGSAERRGHLFGTDAAIPAVFLRRIIDLAEPFVREDEVDRSPAR